MKRFLLLIGMLGCGAGEVATDPEILPPPKKDDPPPPFAVTVALTDSVIGSDCLYLLAFQANDSTTTVSYAWNISATGSYLPNVGAITGGMRGSFAGRHEQKWQWSVPADGSSFWLALSWAVAATNYDTSGGLSGGCP